MHKYLRVRKPHESLVTKRTGHNLTNVRTDIRTAYYAHIMHGTATAVVLVLLMKLVYGLLAGLHVLKYEL